MDTLIVQLDGRHGRLAEVIRPHGDTLSAGRGFANDLVLSDPYVAQEQLRFYRQDQQWYLSVLDNINPVLLNDQVVDGADIALASGDRLLVGRTNLTVYSHNHAVEATRKLVLSRWLHRGASGMLLPLVALFCVLLLDGCVDFYRLSKNLQWQDYVSSALWAGGIVVAWAALWSLAGRLFRHQQHFGLQLLATVGVFALAVIATPLLDYIEFYANSAFAGKVANYALGFAVVALLLRMNLYFATNLRNSAVVSVICSALLIAFLYGLFNFRNDDFQSEAEISSLVKAPFAPRKAAVSMSDYMSAAQAMTEFPEEE